MLRFLSTLIGLLFKVGKGSVLAVQYPLLSGNRIFKYFIKVLHYRKAKVFCIVHDLNGLRSSYPNPPLINPESDLLNHYDCIIVHNDCMKQWLLESGVKKPMINLGVFDYLATSERQATKQATTQQNEVDRKVVFAGNLGKSTFIYNLHTIKHWHFNLYGPYYTPGKSAVNTRISWMGSFHPDEVIDRLNGSFGLIWDGPDIKNLDNQLGHYLYYNNPHKLSLYLAAGLPVITHKKAAIASFIQDNKLGILVNDLAELDGIVVLHEQYAALRQNVNMVKTKITDGQYLSEAIRTAEAILRKRILTA